MTHYTFSLTHGTGKNKTVATVRVIETASLYELADILLVA